MNKSYTQTILEAISRALNSGTNDVITVAVSLSAVILLIIILSLSLKWSNRRNIRKSAMSSYQKLVRKFNLSIQELDLLENLAQALRHPEKKYLLLVNRGTFRYAVQKTGDLNEDKLELLESLSSKLGFSSGIRYENTHSTKSLKAGYPVKLETSTKQVLSAEIYSVSDTGIIIKYNSKHHHIADGEKVTLFACHFDGFKVHNLTAEKGKEDLFSAHHAEFEIFNKRSVRFKVLVENEREEHIETRKTIVILIARKGAVLLNTPNRLRPGDDIKIFMDNDKKHLYHVNAEVIKAPITSRQVTARFTHFKN